MPRRPRRREHARPWHRSDSIDYARGPPSHDDRELDSPRAGRDRRCDVCSFGNTDHGSNLACRMTTGRLGDVKSPCRAARERAASRCSTPSGGRHRGAPRNGAARARRSRKSRKKKTRTRTRTRATRATARRAGLLEMPPAVGGWPPEGPGNAPGGGWGTAGGSWKCPRRWVGDRRRVLEMPPAVVIAKPVMSPGALTPAAGGVHRARRRRPGLPRQGAHDMVVWSEQKGRPVP
jgi:hypothetical protein